MEAKDYYKIMGLSRNASQEEVKRAYRRLARKYHPDVSKEPDAEQRFKDIGEAYEVLRDPQKRAAYDQLGAHWQAEQDFRPPPGWDAGFDFGASGFGNEDFAFKDVFESVFGGRGGFGGNAHAKGRGRGFRSKGKDHRAQISISLEDAYHGVNRTIQLQIPEADGLGHVHAKSRTLNVKIPKGITEGRQIRLAGQGAPGIGGGANGDLYLEIHFEPHRLYRVEEKDVYLELPLAPWEAALGAIIHVPVLGGRVEMKVPPGTKAGQKMRLKGRGLPGTPPGDCYVSFQIALPPAESEQARELYRQMAARLSFDPRAGL